MYKKYCMLRPGYKLSAKELIDMQSWDLDKKILKSQELIREYYSLVDGKIYVAFSGGKDSSVLLDIVRGIYPETPAVFSNTGLEYPELIQFVKSTPNVEILRPDVTFKEVLDNHGYPIISKKIARAIRDLRNPSDKNKNIRKLYLEGVNRKGESAKSWKLAKKWYFLMDAPFKISDKCCDNLKKAPFHKYEKNGLHRIMGLMADDGEYRKNSILQKGFTVIGKTTNYSIPLGFWTRSDILEYIYTHNTPYCKRLYGEIYIEDGVYKNTGVYGTGCIFCMFGVHLEKSPNRFERMKNTHPALWKYCMDELGVREVLEYINIKYE